MNMQLIKDNTCSGYSLKGLKESDLILMGASPQTPGIYRITDKSMKKGRHPFQCMPPHASVTSYGARVASQHGPVLRTGGKMIALKREKSIWIKK